MIILVINKKKISNESEKISLTFEKSKFQYAIFDTFETHAQ